MAGLLVIGAEGVILQRDQGSYAASRPITEGLELITQLKHHPTTMIQVIVHSGDLDGANYWMRMHGLVGVGVIIPDIEDHDESPAMQEWYALERLRSRGPVNLVVTSHPEVFERCSLTHQPVLLYSRRGSIGEIDASLTWEAVRNRIIKRREAEAEVDETTEDA